MMTALVLMSACSDPGDPDRRSPSDGRQGGAVGGGPVVVSVPPLAFLAERLVGPERPVVVMVPPGASPALYEPTVEQMRAVSRASLYVAVGHPRFPFERGWLEQIAASNPDMPVVRAGEDCRMSPGDPHLWMSPACVRRMVGVLAGALADRGGHPPDSLPARRRSLLAEVDRVDARVAALLGPHRGRAFLVFHPSLGYLAREYGLRQMSIQRGATEPGAGELARLIREAREAGIRTVFVQPQFSREAARLVARELTGGSVETVNPLARDWAGNLVGIARRLAASFRPAVRGRDDRVGSAARSSGAP